MADPSDGSQGGVRQTRKSPIRALTSACNLLEARMKIIPYNQHTRLPSSRVLVSLRCQVYSASAEEPTLPRSTLTYSLTVTTMSVFPSPFKSATAIDDAG